MYFYDPPLDCREMDADPVPEWHFEAANNCLFAYTDGDGKEQTVSSHDVIPGLVTFSFHAKSEDDIKCYLHYKGGSMRFLPEDVGTVLPWLFADAQSLPPPETNHMAVNLPDPAFTEFLKNYKTLSAAVQ